MDTQDKLSGLVAAATHALGGSLGTPVYESAPPARVEFLHKNLSGESTAFHLAAENFVGKFSVMGELETLQVMSHPYTDDETEIELETVIERDVHGSFIVNKKNIKYLHVDIDIKNGPETAFQQIMDYVSHYAKHATGATTEGRVFSPLDYEKLDERFRQVTLLGGLTDDKGNAISSLSQIAK